MCGEMAELGLDIGRLATQAARQEWAAHEQPPAPQPATQAARSKRAPQPPRQTEPRERPASPTLAFIRLTREIRQIIALEVQLAAPARQAADAAARQANDRARLAALPQTQHQTLPPSAPEPPPRRPTQQEPNPVPSLLATLSRDLGIDLEDPTLPDRFPPVRRPQTGPPD